MKPGISHTLSHCAVSSMALAHCNASICHAVSLAVDWLVLNHHVRPRTDPFHFPLFHLFHINPRPLYCLCSPLPAWITCYAIYLPMCMPPSTPCTITATACPTVTLPQYSLLSGLPRIYRITQVNIPLIWIMVLQLQDQYLTHYIFQSARKQSFNWISRWKWRGLRSTGQDDRLATNRNIFLASSSINYPLLALEKRRKIPPSHLPSSFTLHNYLNQ
jgi:hypothetical protein